MNRMFVATGDSEFGQCDVDSWKDTVAISAAGGFTAGLKSDGALVSALKKKIK